jgi:hypothetical protein
MKRFPADNLGIPLSIWIPPSYRNEEGRLDFINYDLDDHHRFAPKKDLLHREGEIGKVLRYSCKQLVPVVLHRQFNAHYDRPIIPKSQAERFGALLLSLARYLPAEAVDVSDGSPESRELTPEERNHIWINNELRPEQGTKVQREIINYVTKREISGADETLIEEFLTTPHEELRAQRGRELFRVAAEVAVQPIAQEYIDAWDSGLLPRQDVRPEKVRPYDIVQARAVPKSARMFIVRHVVKDQYALNRAVDQLYDHLAPRYGLALQTGVNEVKLAA